MLDFSPNENAEKKTDRIHFDYEKNLAHASQAIENYYDYDQERKPKLQLITCLDGKHKYLLISRNFPNLHHLSNFAIPIEFNQTNDEYKKQFKDIWISYKQMENEYEAHFQTLQSNKN